ncbi:Uncharacterised protein [Mycobacteroides abscessus subsp. abscessus]|nr:Uncharacterised protein [Mycobacteroides abscessus subsp. abscessus]
MFWVVKVLGTMLIKQLPNVLLTHVGEIKLIFSNYRFEVQTNQ